MIGSNSLCVVVFQLISICYFTPDINLAAILFESLSIFHNGAVILLQSTQQSTVIPVIQIGVIGIVRGIEKIICRFFGFIITFQVGIVVHSQTIKRSMSSVLLQPFLNHLQRFFKIMVQEQGKRIFQDIILRSNRGIYEFGISLGCFTETVGCIIHSGKLLVRLQKVGSQRLQLLQFVNGLRWAGRSISPGIFQISLFTVRIKIDSLFVKLAGTPYIFLSKGNVSLQDGHARIFLIHFLSHFQITLRLRQLAYIQIGAGYGDDE